MKTERVALILLAGLVCGGLPLPVLAADSAPGTPAELVKTYASLADGILALKRTEEDLCRSQGLFDEGFVIVTRAAKAKLLESSRAFGQMARAPKAEALEAEWKKVEAVLLELLKPGK